MDYFFGSQIFKIFTVTIVFLMFYLSVNKLINSLVERLDNSNKKMFEKVCRTINQYLFFLIYLLFVLNVIVDIRVFASLFVLLFVSLILVFRIQITSIVIGFYRIMNKVIAVNDKVIINNKHEGTIREITLNTVKLFKGSHSVVTMAHSEVKTIEKTFDGVRPICSKVVISFRENPEKVEDVLIKLTDKLNEKFTDYLLKDEVETILHPFEYKGITKPNSDYQGVEYAILGYVHLQPDAFEELQRKLDREMAICCYKNNLKMTEQNVFFKTRTDSK